MISKSKIKLIKSLKYKKTRDELNLFLVEGLKGILEVNKSNYDKKNFKINLILCVSTVIISDFITSSIMKPYFERLRPCNDSSLQGLINVVAGCGKKFSFASSHASTTFSLATIFYLISNKKIKLMFLWSILIGYSRIYLGVHFFLDVIFGFLVGYLTSNFIYRISKKFKLF